MPFRKTAENRLNMSRFEDGKDRVNPHVARIVEWEELLPRTGK